MQGRRQLQLGSALCTYLFFMSLFGRAEKCHLNYLKYSPKKCCANWILCSGGQCSVEVRVLDENLRDAGLTSHSALETFLIIVEQSQNLPNYPTYLTGLSWRWNGRRENTTRHLLLCKPAAKDQEMTQQCIITASNQNAWIGHFVGIFLICYIIKGTWPLINKDRCWSPIILHDTDLTFW